MRKIAKARTHSLCGQHLDAITLYEVIPANQFNFIDKEYREGLLSDELPELITELRCSYCNETLKGADLEYVKNRLHDGEENLEEVPVKEAGRSRFKPGAV